MAYSKKTLHIIALYALVIALFVFVLAINQSPSALDEDWVCVQEVCVESAPAGEAWAEQNCGEVETEQGDVIVACALVIDGVQQVVPIDALNLSAIEACTQYQCLQEVRVRPVNYTFTP